MRVTVVSCVFPPEPVVSAQTSADLAKAMSDRGHAVTVVTAFPNRPGGKIYSGYSRHLFQRAQAGPGVTVLRCFSLFSARSHVVSRFFENLSFGIASCIAVLLLPRPDVAYVNTWPLVASGLVFVAARLRGIPVVLSLQDVYPESLVSQQRLRPSSRIADLLRRLDGCIARRSAALIAISPSFAALYRATRQVAPDRVAVVPNWVDSRSIEVNDPDSASVRSQFGIPADACLAVYGGNIGAAAGVDTVIDALQSLRAQANIHLLIAGEGAQLAFCQERVRAAGSGAVSFFTPWPKSETSRLLGAADFLILPTRGQQSLASVPSKLIAYMLAARPIVVLAYPNSDLARIVERAGCGWVVPPDQPEALAERLRAMASLPTVEMARRGLAGRDYALGHFVSEVCLPQVVGVVEQAAAKS